MRCSPDPPSLSPSFDQHKLFDSCTTWGRQPLTELALRMSWSSSLSASRNISVALRSWCVRICCSISIRTWRAFCSVSTSALSWISFCFTTSSSCSSPNGVFQSWQMEPFQLWRLAPSNVLSIGRCQSFAATLHKFVITGNGRSNGSGDTR